MKAIFDHVLNGVGGLRLNFPVHSFQVSIVILLTVADQWLSVSVSPESVAVVVHPCSLSLMEITVAVLLLLIHRMMRMVL